MANGVEAGVSAGRPSRCATTRAGSWDEGVVPAEAGTTKGLEPQEARDRVSHEREQDRGGHDPPCGRDDSRSALAFECQAEPNVHCAPRTRGEQRPGLGWTPPGSHSFRTIRSDVRTTVLPVVAGS